MDDSFASRVAFRAAALLLGCLLAGCAALAPTPPAIDPLLHDDWFGQPPRPAEADDVFALDDAMRAFLRQSAAAARRPEGAARALAEALYTRGQLRLEYDASVTRNAAQAFAARAGNCLSLVIMTAAFARELGLPVTFQAALAAPADGEFRRESGLTLQSGHVNMVLGPRRPHADRRVLSPGGSSGESLQIDFLPPEDLSGLRTQPISEATVLAMFMNNRAVEALLAQRPVEAYAWVREALRQAPGFSPAFNTLGVVYQRAGRVEAAAAVLAALLAQYPDNVVAMDNLAPLLKALGRTDEAAAWTARRLALEPVPPFQHLRQGQEAVARGAFDEGLAQFARERRITGATHELAFWEARAWFGRGDAARAQQALREAVALAGSAGQQALYAGKLAWLRQHARP